MSKKRKAAQGPDKKLYLALGIAAAAFLVLMLFLGQ